jgi:hypothetical protein
VNVNRTFWEEDRRRLSFVVNVLQALFGTDGPIFERQMGRVLPTFWEEFNGFYDITLPLQFLS